MQQNLTPNFEWWYIHIAYILLVKDLNLITLYITNNSKCFLFEKFGQTVYLVSNMCNTKYKLYFEIIQSLPPPLWKTESVRESECVCTPWWTPPPYITPLSAVWELTALKYSSLSQCQGEGGGQGGINKQTSAKTPSFLYSHTQTLTHPSKLLSTVKY